MYTVIYAASPLTQKDSKMSKFSLIILTALLALGSQNLSANNNRAGFDLGVAYDLDEIGITAQFSRYSLFFDGDSAAFDVRVQNFYNDRKTLHFYIDIGAFIIDRGNNNGFVEDSVGIRAPVGMMFGLERNLEAYIQAVPSYDFENDGDFDVNGALGIRYRF